MFNMFRVAGLAAATVLLCAAPATAAAQTIDQNLAPAAAVQPDAPVAEAPAATVEQAPFSLIVSPAVEPGTADAQPLGRARPDRITPSQAAPSQSVVSQGSQDRPLAELVAQHAGAETGDEQFECLARAVYFESRGEPLEGQLAVAEVILNRVASGRFRATICDVVKQPSQFSFVRRGVIPNVPRDSSAWQRSVAIAHIAMQNLADVTGDNSLFFHATYVNPGWGRPRIARIGNHIFYR
jgi:hypothetical protein